MKKMVLSLLVHNEAGVTSRIAGLFTRRGYNMDSITGGVTQNPMISRITVVVHGDDNILEQVTKQLAKLEDVVEIEELLPEGSVCRELILVRVAVNEIQRPEVIAVANIFRANVVDVARDSLMIELTGDKSKLDAFLQLLTGYEILGIARTGITGLSRGAFSNQG
ncbi:MAG: acetolactate synthase small subunit [Butyrivibrio sp.]|nr:acetolactate synthase small subunit [Butyrivibrio sp.]